MNTYRVFFTKEKKEVTVQEGTTVLEVERMAGLSPDAPCGGAGKCGKCTARINGVVEKACQIKVTSDLEVETIEKESEHRILVKGTERAVAFRPELEILDIEIRPCTVGENSSDWTRLCEAINRNLQEKGSKADRVFQPKLEVLPVVSRLMKEKGGKARAIISEDQILELKEQDDKPVLMAAFDIGTTTVAGYLLDGKTGEQLATASALNTQTEYGADVIMRANYSLEHGADELSTCIRVLLKKLIRKLCTEASKEPEDIYQVSVVGNTCMHHLFLGISPASLVHAPYNPAISQGLTLNAEQYGLHIHRKGQLLMLPDIAGYVGADTCGCILALRQDQQNEISLMIDIGTNGEMVLGNKTRLACCSTAAGPAFEGAKIECGMRGGAGAVDHVVYKDGKWEYTTIGNKAPAGLCGSGLIDLVAQLYLAGFIDESGHLESGQEKAGVFVLVPPEKSGNDRGVYLTQKDIGEVQLAKAAIAAGIFLLMKRLEITEKDIKRVYLAGAFGNYMNPESAAAIGMFPAGLLPRIQPVGNAAGEGARIALLNEEERKEMDRTVKNMDFVELAASPEFQDCFVDGLCFP